MAEECPAENLDLARWVRSGDRVSWGHGSGEPQTLTEALVAQRHVVGPIRAFLGSSFTQTVRPEHADAIQFTGMGAVGTTKDFLKAGVLDLVPCHISDVPRLLAEGLLTVDVVLVQLAVDEDGAFSLGVANSYLSAMMRHARVVIAEVNASMAWTHSRVPVDPSDIDVIVRTNRAVVEVPGRDQPSESELAIASHIVPLIPEGAIIQIGIGNLPSAIMSGLMGHRRLGIHSGVIGDAVVQLIQSGVVTNCTKPVDRGVTVTGALFGSRKLYAFADRNAAVRVDTVEYTNSFAVLSGFDSFITLNSALEVDLTGQINGEALGRAYLGTVGGQVDFIRGALASRGGRSVVALPSVAGAKLSSRVVTQIGSGVTTTGRADADVFVTEHGVAHLRGRSIPERVRAMIAIADPNHRERLAREAHETIAGYR